MSLSSLFLASQPGRVSGRGAISLLHVPIAFIDLGETNGASGRRGIFYGKVDPEFNYYPTVKRRVKNHECFSKSLIFCLFINEDYGLAHSNTL